MFTGLLSIYTAGSFERLLAHNFEGRMKCISLNNWPCQARPTLAKINSRMKLFFLHLLAMLINVVEVVILLMVNMPNFMFQRKWEIRM